MLPTKTTQNSSHISPTSVLLGPLVWLPRPQLGPPAFGGPKDMLSASTLPVVRDLILDVSTCKLNWFFEGEEKKPSYRFHSCTIYCKQRYLLKCASGRPAWHSLPPIFATCVSTSWCSCQNIHQILSRKVNTEYCSHSIGPVRIFINIVHLPIKVLIFQT